MTCIDGTLTEELYDAQETDTHTPFLTGSGDEALTGYDLTDPCGGHFLTLSRVWSAFVRVVPSWYDLSSGGQRGWGSAESCHNS